MNKMGIILATTWLSACMTPQLPSDAVLNQCKQQMQFEYDLFAYAFGCEDDNPTFRALVEKVLPLKNKTEKLCEQAGMMREQQQAWRNQYAAEQVRLAKQRYGISDWLNHAEREQKLRMYCEKQQPEIYRQLKQRQ